MATTLQTPTVKTPTVNIPTVTTPTAQGPKLMTFSIKAPQARKVLLAGDFTDWEKNARPLKRHNGEGWQTKVSLSPGRHQYKFIVDGEWQVDPACGQQEANSFGTTNNVIEVK